MSPNLCISLLGTFKIIYKGQPHTTINSVRLQSLLAYLVLHAGEPQSRQHLAFLFWPDSTESQARTNLRKALYDLRHSLPDADTYLQVERATVLWYKTAEYRLDVEELSESLHQIADETADRNGLAKVVELYRGDLLMDCYDDWVLSLREQYRRRVQRALERFVTLLENRRAYDDGIRYARRLLDLDPLAEPTYQRLIRLYALNGDRSSALRIYHDCVKMLRRELGVDPSDTTQQIYSRILKREVHVSEPATNQLDIVADTVNLVGRTHEWQTLQSAWKLAAQGHAQFVAICGEAGIGKSRLAEEFLMWVSHQGADTAQARSHEVQGELAYAPVADLLRADAIRRHQEQLDDVWLVELTRLLPDLLSKRTDLPRPQPMTESWQRLHFFEAMANALRPQQQPILLLIDDLQWCDQETLAWLHYLISHYKNERTLILGTVRDDELDETHAFRTLQADLSRVGQMTTVNLAPLSEEETTSLAAKIVESELTLEQTSGLYAATEGNPLFVVETLRAETLFETWAGSNLTGGTTITGLPPKVYGVLQHRLAQLSPPAQIIASLAAVIGRSFSYDVLREASQQGEDNLVDSLDELWRRRIVIERGETYDFSHDRLRDVAYAEISATRRRLLHRRVAESLVAIHSEDLSTIYGQLAAHYASAGMVQDAVSYYLQAGDQSQRLYARHEALSHYTRAAELADGNDVLPDILARRGQLLLDFFQGDAAASDYERLLEQARHNQDSLQELDALLGLGWAHYVISMDQPESDSIASSWQYYEAAYAVASAIEDKRGMIRARIGTRYHFMYSQKYLDPTRINVDEALALSREIGDDDLLIDSVLAAVHFQKLSDWEKEAEALVPQLVKMGDRTRLNELYFLLLIVHVVRGHYARAIEFGEIGIKLATEIGVPPVLFPSYIAFAQIRLGRFNEAKVTLQQEVTDDDHPFSDAFNCFVRALYLLEILDYEQAVIHLEHVIEQAIQLKRSWLKVLALTHLGRALAQFEQADPEKLRGKGQELSGLDSTHWALVIGQPAVARSEIALRMGQFDKALQHIDVAIADAEAKGRQPDFVIGMELRARIYLQLEKLDRAVAVAEKGLELGTAIGDLPIIWRLYDTMAQALQKLGNQGEAIQAFQKTATIIHQLAATIPVDELRQKFLAAPRVSSIMAGLDEETSAV